ncbi:hypothetical protein [Streptomyces violascens]|uniref:hypothetical protein n=1 Tax=Streptomyces violascens TaxID=67381 RepID=UPI00365ED111
MDLEDADAKVAYLIRDRDAKFPVLFDEILADAGIQVALCGVWVPRMKSVLERQAVRHELLDRDLVWNQRHLLHTLHGFERHHNTHRPHQAMNLRSVAAHLLVGHPHAEAHVVVLAVDGDAFGVLARDDGPLLALDILRKSRQAPRKGLRTLRRPRPPPARGALRPCTAGCTTSLASRFCCSGLSRP